MRTNIFNETQTHRSPEDVEVIRHTAKESRQRVRQEDWKNKEGEKHGLKEKRRKLRKYVNKDKRKGRVDRKV